jgi:hypothetical protein
MSKETSIVAGAHWPTCQRQLSHLYKLPSGSRTAPDDATAAVCCCWAAFFRRLAALPATHDRTGRRNRRHLCSYTAAAAVTAAAIKITSKTAGDKTAAYGSTVQGKATNRSALMVTCDNIQGLLWCDPVLCQRLQQAVQQLTQHWTHSHLVPEQHQHTHIVAHTYPTQLTIACHRLAEFAIVQSRCRTCWVLMRQYR